MKGTRRTTSEPVKLLAYVFLGVGALVTLYPFYWMITASTLTESEIFRSPPRLLAGSHFLSNLEVLSEAAPFLRAMLNSILVSGVTTASTVLCFRRSPVTRSPSSPSGAAICCLRSC